MSLGNWFGGPRQHSGPEWSPGWDLLAIRPVGRCFLLVEPRFSLPGSVTAQRGQRDRACRARSHPGPVLRALGGPPPCGRARSRCAALRVPTSVCPTDDWLLEFGAFALSSRGWSAVWVRRCRRVHIVFQQNDHLGVVQQGRRSRRLVRRIMVGEASARSARTTWGPA